MPSSSAVNVGLAVVDPPSVAPLVAGFVVSDQLYVMGSPSASRLPVPSSLTDAPVPTA